MCSEITIVIEGVQTKRIFAQHMKPQSHKRNDLLHTPRETQQQSNIPMMSHKFRSHSQSKLFISHFSHSINRFISEIYLEIFFPLSRLQNAPEYHRDTFIYTRTQTIYAKHRSYLTHYYYYYCIYRAFRQLPATVSATYFDVSSDFDLVTHTFLLRKLSSFSPTEF